MARLGLTYADFQTTKPDIIYCGCYGFRKEGPYADRPAYDDVIQGVSGLSAIMDLTAVNLNMCRHYLRTKPQEWQ